MARIVTFLDEEMIKKLKEISNNSNKSVSKITAELIEAGYNIKYNNINNLQQKKQELTDKHTEYLLKILAIIQDMYHCVRNDKSHYDTENTAEALRLIKTNITEELDEFLQQK